MFYLLYTSDICNFWNNNYTLSHIFNPNFGIWYNFELLSPFAAWCKLKQYMSPSILSEMCLNLKKFISIHIQNIASIQGCRGFSSYVLINSHTTSVTWQLHCYNKIYMLLYGLLANIYVLARGCCACYFVRKNQRGLGQIRPMVIGFISKVWLILNT